MKINHSNTTKASSSNIYRANIIPNQENKINNLKIIKIRNRQGNNSEERPFLKVFYKSSNFFYNDGSDGYCNYQGNRNNFHFGRKLYSNSNNSINSYNKDSNSNNMNMNIDYENDYIKYIPFKKNSQYFYNDNSSLSNQMMKMNLYNKNSSQSNLNNSFSDNINDRNMEYYDDNIIGDSENNYNENDYYINENENENENENDNMIYENNIIIKKSPPHNFKCNRWNSNKSFYSAPKADQNIRMSSNDKIIKVRTIKKNIQNFGNNNYNNNIYYINPININRKYSNIHKSKKKNNDKRRSLEYISHKKVKNNDKDYYRINNININRNHKNMLTKAATLIQSIFRRYSIKKKIVRCIYTHMNIESGLEIVENILLKVKKKYWNIFKNNISIKISENINEIKKTYFSFKLKSKYKKNYLNDFLSNSYYKDIKDIHNSYNTMNEVLKTENSDNDFKSDMNYIIKENDQLKIQLYDYKKMEEKLNMLTEENKKYKSINDIIMKHNKYLEKKIKEIQEYKNLAIENQCFFYLSQRDNKNDMYLFKLKKFISAKLIYKKINNNTSVEDKINKLRDITKKEIYIKNIMNIIEKHYKLRMNKYFLKLYKYSQMEKEKKIKAFLLNNKLRKILHNKEKKNKEIKRQIFFKFVLNVFKYDNQKLKKAIKENKKNSEMLKIEKLQKIFTNYERNVRLIYKVNLEKWFLKSIIIGIKASARDKKKKRKQKKKINKIIYNKYFDIKEKNNSSKNLDTKFTECLNLFKNLTSEPPVLTKEPLSNECYKIIENNLNNNNTINRTTNINNDEKNKETINNIRNKYKSLNRKYISDKDN